MGTLLYSRPQHYWSFTIRLFSVISRKLVGGVSPLCRDAVGVFHSLSRLSYRTLVEGVLPLCRDAVGVFYSSSQLGYRTLVGGILPLYRDAVGVFYSPSWLGQIHRELCKKLRFQHTNKWYVRKQKIFLENKTHKISLELGTTGLYNPCQKIRISYD